MDFLILTDIMKAVLGFLWIMYIWESYLSHRQVFINDKISKMASPSRPITRVHLANIAGAHISV